MQEARFLMPPALRTLVVIIVGLMAAHMVASAQEPPKLPPFNTPYSCPDGLTYTVLSCQVRGRLEMCTFQTQKDGGQPNNSYTTRAQLSRRLQSCQPLQASQPGSAQAMDPPYLSEMPSVERVTREIQGKDSIDTAARQAGAFWQLRQVIYDIALSQRRTDRQHTPDERRLANAYYAAYYSVWQPLEKSLSQDRPRLFKLQGYTADREFLDEALTRLGAASVRAEYARAKGIFVARHEQFVREGKEQQARAQAEAQEYLAQQQPSAGQRELARCIASGRSETQCFVEAFGKDMAHMQPILKKIPRPAGLFLSGVYAGQGGFSVTFYPEVTMVGCKGISAQGNYAVEMKDNQVVVRLLQPSPAASPAMGIFQNTEALAKLLPQTPGANPEEWQSQRVVFPLRPDGRMAAVRIAPQPSGTIQVTGPVPVGTRQGTRTVTETVGGLTTTRSEPTTETVYAMKTATCLLGILAPTGPAPVLGSMSTAPAAVLNLAFGGEDKNAGKVPPPGLRMNGQYVGQAGFDIEFHPESAVLACRQAVIARDYTVSMKGNQILVNIQDSTKPIVLELRPDGKLAGSGPVQINARAIVGKDANGQLVYQPTSDTCTLGVLTPAPTGSASTAKSTEKGVVTRSNTAGQFNRQERTTSAYRSP